MDKEYAVNKILSIHRKKNEIPSLETTWLEVKITMLIEIYQEQEDIYSKVRNSQF